MNGVGDIERMTQNKVVQLFRDKLKYAYLGNWEERQDNSNVEEEYLTKYLKDKKHYNDILINRAIDQFRKAANNLNDGLYRANKNVYDYIRYGIKVPTDSGQDHVTIQLIDWKNPSNNHFAIAEEVTIRGVHDKRPDIVLYVNGIALGVLELKRSTVSVNEGIRQNLTNQQPDFIQPFFSTIQLIFAGSDTEGLRYGTIGTSEKYYLKWKEESEVENLLDKYLLILCDKQRFLEIIYHFILFDGGIKKLCRPHQYFGVRAAQEHVIRHESGIIWHTQGSGKSLVMVWLAKWILENNPHARIVIITDRDELDKQIERVFADTGEKMHRTSSGYDLMQQLGKAKPRLLCSLVHKFGRRVVDNFDAFIKELEEAPRQIVGELFVFVDECHRTQSGKLHSTMKAILRDAVFIGFTGTPLLKKDRPTSLEVFGKYIHTYKFNEAVEDEVVLDLVYEARDIDQKITAPERIDEWFEAKTKNLNEFQQSALKRKWGTMQQVLSCRQRLDMIVNDIVFDFNVKQRLNNDNGNAILIASSIFEACRFFELFQKTELKDKCTIVTSFNPSIKDIKNEETGANSETDRQYMYNLYTKLLNRKMTEVYEDEAKDKFIKEPANMKLLIVVDKLLTGFDAPPCTYLYINKSMKDHGLFQAICRVNRLDSEDKQFGFVIDYKDLFKPLENAVAVYTSELDYDTFEKEDVDVLLKDRLEKGKERLDGALEKLALICEPVQPPKSQMDYIRYFCGNPEIEADLKSREVKRNGLYKHTVAFIRAYANIAGEMTVAGYSEAEIDEIKKKLDFYLRLRGVIKNASGETLDTKAYEADMRHLMDTYIQAKEPRKISPFDNMSLLDIIVNSGIAEAINSLPDGIRSKQEAIAETIENNVRKKIIEEYLVDPAYFEKMSKVLNEIIKERKQNAIHYKEYLEKIAALVKRVNNPMREDLSENIRSSRARTVLYHNLGEDEQLAIRLDGVIKDSRRADWRGNIQKENTIKAAIYKVINDEDEVERIFPIIKAQGEY